MIYYSKEGKTITFDEWANRVESDKRVAETTLEDGTWISTVWLGIDHSFISGGLPIIFETMVFPSKDDIGERDMERYSTLEEAQAGHLAMVEKWEHNH